jgi:hypothetical protein
MTTRIPRPGERYLHFKNRQYQVITVAKHSESGDELVIYQALYGDFKTYARPLEMFLEEVDLRKYPQATQKERFKLIEEHSDTVILADVNQDSGEMNRVGVRRSRQNSQPQRAISKSRTDGVSPLLMDFFDAETYEEKYSILLEMRDDVSDIMINNMAVVLDIVIPEGDLDVRYEELKRCLRTRERYEIIRRR